MLWLRKSVADNIWSRAIYHLLYTCVLTCHILSHRIELSFLEQRERLGNCEARGKGTVDLTISSPPLLFASPGRTHPEA